ncbi:MAG: SDR family NAD(P)-dependent oxidoreductase [Pseudomonadota bacterium]
MKDIKILLNSYIPKDNYLSRKFIIITGATSGIGRALAISCAKLGAELLLLSKNQQSLDSIRKELAEISAIEHQTYSIDFSLAGETDYIKFAEYIYKQNKTIDSLVLNAGYLESLQGVRNMVLDSWLKTITVNQHAPFMLVKCCIPLLELADDPSIVFTTHESSKAYWGAYATAKTAQLGLLKILADELDGDKPIRVNGVDPAPVATKLRLNNFPGINPKEFAKPEDVLAPYLFFIGPDSKGTTGTNYKINPYFIG